MSIFIFKGFGQTSRKKKSMVSESWVLGTCQRTLIYLGDLGKNLCVPSLLKKTIITNDLTYLADTS